MAEVLDLRPETLTRWRSRRRDREQPAPGRRRPGRPQAIPPAARWKLRQRYTDSLGQWGPKVLVCWARREGLGSYSPTTIARAIDDLRPEPVPEPPPLRYEITTPGAVWSEDGAGFRDRGRKRELLLVQDECSRLKVGHAIGGGPATGAEVRAVLEIAFSEYGAPLVLKRDGGSIFDEQGVRELLDEHGVLSLVSPPATPGYNGKMERAVRDVRSHERAQREHGVDGSLDDRIDRARFRREVERRRMELESEATSRHERDAASRMAIEDVLSRYGLVTWKGDVSTNSRREIRTK